MKLFFISLDLPSLLLFRAWGFFIRLGEVYSNRTKKEENLHKNKFFKCEDLRCVLSICLHDKLNGFSSFMVVSPGSKPCPENTFIKITTRSWQTDGRTDATLSRNPEISARELRSEDIISFFTPGIRIKIGVALSRLKGNLQGVFGRKREKKGGEKERKKREWYI